MRRRFSIRRFRHLTNGFGFVWWQGYAGIIVNIWIGRFGWDMMYSPHASKPEPPLPETGGWMNPDNNVQR